MHRSGRVLRVGARRAMALGVDGQHTMPSLKACIWCGVICLAGATCWAMAADSHLWEANPWSSFAVANGIVCDAARNTCGRMPG